MPSLLRNIVNRARVSTVHQQGRDVKRFLEAFPSPDHGYRVQIVSRETEFRRNYEGISAAAVLDLVDTGKLAHLNANGSCIFLRPLRRDLVFIDDLSPADAKQLEKIGFAPACVIQSSPKKTNVVLRVPNLDPNPSLDAGDAKSFHTATQTRVIEHLRELGMPADTGAARDLQVWRMPGFSNQKRTVEFGAELKYSPRFFATITHLAPDAVAERAVDFADRIRQEREIEREGGVETKKRRRSSSSAAIVLSSKKEKEDFKFNPTAFDAAARAKLHKLWGKGELPREKVILEPTRYLEAGLNKVRNAPEGERRKTLLSQASVYFRFSAGTADAVEYRKEAGFDSQDLYEKFRDAALEAGLEALEIEKTIHGAAEFGASDPIFPEIAGLRDALQKQPSVKKCVSSKSEGNPYFDDFGQPVWPRRLGDPLASTPAAAYDREAAAAASDLRLDARERAAVVLPTQKPARRS